MSARLKLKHMKHRIAMIEAENNHLHYELSRLSVKWELVGTRERLEPIGLAMAPKEYLKCEVSTLSRSIIAKMCDNLEDCITKQIPDYLAICGDILDVRLLSPKFTETLVEVTVR